MNRLLLIIIGTLVVGCAPTKQWVKPGATQWEFDRHMAQCKYEAAAATATIGTTPTYNLNHALAAGMSAGITSGLRQVELIKLCMQKEGYRLEPIKKGKTSG